MSITLGGNVVIRNGNQYDFPWRECIKSLLPVCDVVSVCEGQSTDGTQEALREWAKDEPKLSLCVWEWPFPKATNGEFFLQWCNYNREHLQTAFQFQLDGDEIVSERSYEEIRRLKHDLRPESKISISMRRFNFYRDHKHLIPKGECLAAQVIRIAPQNMWLASDGYDARGVPVADMAAGSGIEIFHYNWLRKREAYFAKEKALQEAWGGQYDERLAKAEKHQGNWMTMPGVNAPDGIGDGWENRLDDFKGEHPEIIKPYLRERGYSV